MGLYRKYVFPRLCNLAMSRHTLNKYRKDLLSDVHGEILEIGFGTGINISFYPAHVKKITVVEPNDGMIPKAMNRVESSGIHVDFHNLGADPLPFSDCTFDSVISTFTLCSIENVNIALSEIERVLRQGGRFFFLEHGLSPDPNVEKWQNRLNSINGVFADGCKLNRNVEDLIRSNNLIISRLENYYLERTPRFAGYLYSGIAEKY